MTTILTTHGGFIDTYTDRHGCGDELYMDRRFRSATVLSRLLGVDALAKGELDEGHGDDFTSH